MSESAIQAQILLVIGARPDCRIWRAQPLAATTRTGRVLHALPRGHPDIAGIIMGGRALYIETKSEDGQLNKWQVGWRDMLIKFGALYVLARSVRDVEAALGKTDGCT